MKAFALIPNGGPLLGRLVLLLLPLIVSSCNSGKTSASLSDFAQWQIDFYGNLQVHMAAEKDFSSHITNTLAMTPGNYLEFLGRQAGGKSALVGATWFDDYSSLKQIVSGSSGRSNSITRSEFAQFATMLARINPNVDVADTDISSQQYDKAVGLFMKVMVLTAHPTKSDSALGLLGCFSNCFGGGSPTTESGSKVTFGPTSTQMGSDGQVTTVGTKTKDGKASNGRPSNASSTAQRLGPKQLAAILAANPSMADAVKAVENQNASDWRTSGDQKSSGKSWEDAAYD